jgi:DNA topoisomerase-3
MAVKKWLIITEKPSVAADLSRALKPLYGSFEKKDDYYTNESFDMTWALGHLLELAQPEDIDPKYKAWLLQDLPIIPSPFKFVPKAKQKSRLKVIQKLLKQKDVVGSINACDAGREGELIFRTIVDYCQTPKPSKRLWLQSLTPDSIRQAFQDLLDGTQTDALGDASHCRIESDWLIGINLTRALTRRLKSRSRAKMAAWSLGRVQTPTLSLVVEREKKILAYQPVQYWTIKGFFDLNGETYEGNWLDSAFSSKEKIQKELESQHGLVIDESEIQKSRIFLEKKFQKIWKKIQPRNFQTIVEDKIKFSEESSPLLYDLTSLQREANQLYGYSSKRTLQAAQALYERLKMITYPRTDSRYLPEDYPTICTQTHLDLIKHYPQLKKLQKQLKVVKSDKKIFNQKKISDHFAIIPTGNVQQISGDSEKIFFLILKRFFETFLEKAQWQKLERLTKCEGEHFLTKQSILKNPGWRQVQALLSPKEQDGRFLTPLQEEQIAKGQAKKFEEEEAWSKAPGRYTESRLLSLMENCGRSVEDEELSEALKEKGLGTPATRAEIIENLLTKEYLIRQGKNLFPTSKAMILMDVLKRIPLDQFYSPTLTGLMEFELKQVEQGKLKRKDFMNKVIELTKTATESCRQFQYEDLYKDNALQTTCFCGKKGLLQETLYSYKCDKCDFLVWKQKGSGYVSPDLLLHLFEKKKVGPLEWLMRGGHTKTAYLCLKEDHSVVLEDEEGNSLEPKKTSEETTLSEKTISETFLSGPAKLITTDQAFYAQYEKPPKGAQNSRLPNLLCQRVMTFEDFLNLIVQGETQIISDFISKKGKPFSAILYLKKNGTFGFKFAQRSKSKSNSSK